MGYFGLLLDLRYIIGMWLISSVIYGGDNSIVGTSKLTDISTQEKNTTRRHTYNFSSIHIIQYTVYLKPHIYFHDPQNFYFWGNVQIEFECTVNTNSISLHTRDVDISLVTLWKNLDKTKVSILNWEYFPYDELTTFLFGSALQAHSEYTLRIQYYGTFIDNATIGVFVQSYATNEGLDHWMMATTLRPNHARSLFPCLDSPDHKAYFKLIVARKKWMTILTIFPKLASFKEEDNSNWIVDYFQTTVKLATYHVAIIVFPRKYWRIVGSRQITNMHLRLWIPTYYREDVAYKTLKYFDKDMQFLVDYLNTSLSLTKIDIFGLTSYDTSAFEHPGLITINSSLIMDYEEFDLSADILTHELCHQWFGTLVTPKTWADLWISEGISSFLTRKALKNSHSDYCSYDVYAYSMQLLSMRTENNPKNTPIFKILSHNPTYEEVYQTSNNVKYTAIADILENIIGKHSFRYVLQVFLNVYKFDSASVVDFVDVLSNVSNNVLTLNKTWPWFNTTGYPIIMVSKLGNIIKMAALHSDLRDLSLNGEEQLNTHFCGAISLSYRIVYRNMLSVTDNIYFDCDNTSVELVLDSDQFQYFLLNTAGLYSRVLYDYTLWNVLIYSLHDDLRNTFDERERMMLLEDSYILSEYGLMDLELFPRIYYVICEQYNNINTITCDDYLDYWNH